MPVEYTWDDLKPALFARRNGEKVEFLYHRWNGKLFYESAIEKARQYTGTDQYGVLSIRENDGITLNSTKISPFEDIARTCRENWQALPYEPVFLIPLYRNLNVR